MKGSKPRSDATHKGFSRQSKYLTLFVWVTGICLSFGVYTLLVNALTRDVPSKTQAPLRPLAPQDVEAVMTMDPSIKVVPPSTTFTITVAIEDVVNLGAFEFEITFNPTCVVTATEVTLGPFLGSTGRSVSPVGPTFGTGSVTYGAFSFGADPGPNGDGVLATITFQAGASTCWSALHLQNIAATETDGDIIPTHTKDGEVIIDSNLGPEVTSVNPSSGYVGEEKKVIVQGQKFQMDASVKLTRSGQNILASSTDVLSSTQISCTLNLGKATVGQWDVVVTNQDGLSGTLINGFTILSPPSPTITSIVPNSGYNNQVVHITHLAGSNFRTGATAKLTKAGETDINATNVIVVSASQITCDFDLIGATVGQWDVVVTNQDSQSGTLPNGFTVSLPLPPPTLTGITPNSGAVNDTVNTSLTGSNFQAGASVELTRTGQTPITATNVSLVSSSQITCNLDLTGAVTGTWNVVVTNPDSQSGTLPGGFTVTVAQPSSAPPEVISITPNSGCNNRVVHITDLSGSNFQTATVALTKTGETNITATNVVVVNPNHITCDLDLRGAFPGQWTVKVTNFDAQHDDLVDGFIVNVCNYLPIVLKNH